MSKPKVCVSRLMARVRVEAAAGDSIEHVSEHATRIAYTLQTYVVFTFNGVEMTIAPDETKLQVVDAFWDAVRNKWPQRRT